MFTWVYGLSSVNGAAAVLIGIGVCWGIYLTAYFVNRTNRNKKGVLWGILSMLAVTFACDVFWLFYFFPHFQYENRGLAGFFWLLLLPGALAILWVVLSSVNELRRRSAERTRAKLERIRQESENNEPR